MDASFHDTLPVTSTPKSILRSTSNYAEILDVFNLNYTSIEYYWQIGTPHSTRDWILHLSVIKDQLPDLLWTIIPVLIDANISFRVIRDGTTALFALNGSLGAAWLGKMICIYPTSPENALALAKNLISLTKGFKGPAIRTDRCLGGIVYTSIGSHTTVPFSLPPNTLWPFAEITAFQIPPKPKLLHYSYYPTSVIKDDAKGDVIKVLYFQKPWKIKSCIIKQGRQNMFMDDAGRDIRDRLQWQYDLHTQLAQELPIPKTFDYFVIDNDSYLVMQFINLGALPY